MQKNVLNIAVCFFDLVKQHHAVRAAAHRLGKLAAFLVPQIARRCADQACNGVLLHIFAHIKAQKCLFGAKPAACQGAGQMRFSHTARPQKQHGAYGSARFTQAGAAAPNGPRHGLHRLFLAHHLLLHTAFQQRQPFALLFCDALCRNPAGPADHRRHMGRCKAFEHAIGHGRRLNAQRCGGFVQQVDGFVRQKAPGQITHAQFHRRTNGFGGNAHAVKPLVARHKPR